MASQNDDTVPPRPRVGNRRSSTRWARLLHFFQLSRRRRANSSTPEPRAFHTSSSANVSRPVSIRPSSSSHRHTPVTQSTGIEMRRVRRERNRFRASHSRTNSSPPVGGARSRRTMSDGALRQTGINSATSSTTSITPSTQRVAPPSPSSRSTVRSTRTIFMPASASMRFRRAPNAGGDGASATSIAGVASAGSGMSDSDDSNAHEDALHRLHSIGSGAGSGTASVASEGRDGRTSTLVSSALADLDAMQEHDLFAVVNRIFDDYPVPPSDAFQSSAVYLSRHPSHAPHRLAMRVRNTYYASGRQHRRNYNGSPETGIRMGMTGMHHHHHHGHGAIIHGHSGIHGGFHGVFGMDDRDIRVHTIQPVRVHEGVLNGFDNAASDAQIEALPSFVMEKGETRSVKEIFESMQRGDEVLRKRERDNHKGDKPKGGKPKGDSNCKDSDEKLGIETEGGETEEEIEVGADDECGGLMTSYTECAICLCDFEPGDEITALPCGHIFHLTGCVREWLAKHARTCPTCRGDICDNGSGSGSGARAARRPVQSPSVSSSISASEDVN